MTPTRINKLMGDLTGRERLSAILAASGRDDQWEYQRLVSSAPNLRFDVQQHFGPAEGIKAAAQMHVIQTLQILTTFWRAMAGGHEAWTDAEFDQWVAIEDGAALAYHVHVAGWRQFCADIAIDPDIIVRELCPMLMDLPDAPSVDEPPDPDSVAEVAEAYRDIFDRLETQWA